MDDISTFSVVTVSAMQCELRGKEVMVGGEFQDGGGQPYPPRKEIGTLNIMGCH